MTVASRLLDLERFSAANASTVLSWRNDARIRDNSLDDREISAADHEKFLALLENRRDLSSFLVRINGHAKAVINMSVSEEGASWGTYLSPQAAPNPGMFPILILIAIQWAFDCNDCDVLKSEVLAHNLAPIRMNAFLGVPECDRYEIQRTAGSSEVVVFELRRSEVKLVRSKALNLLTKAQREMLERFLASDGNVSGM